MWNHSDQKWYSWLTDSSLNSTSSDSLSRFVSFSDLWQWVETKKGEVKRGPKTETFIHGQMCGNFCYTETGGQLCIVVISIPNPNSNPNSISMPCLFMAYAVAQVLGPCVLLCLVFWLENNSNKKTQKKKRSRENVVVLFNCCATTKLTNWSRPIKLTIDNWECPSIIWQLSHKLNYVSSCQQHTHFSDLITWAVNLVQ